MLFADLWNVTFPTMDRTSLGAVLRHALKILF